MHMFLTQIIIIITREGESPEMAPPLPRHSALLRQVPESPVLPVHSSFGNFTIANKLQTDIQKQIVGFRFLQIRLRPNKSYLKILSPLVLFFVSMTMESPGITV